MATAYGGITLVNTKDATRIWTASSAPTSPWYTFAMSSLNVSGGTVPNIGDLIMYDGYQYTISSVSSNSVLAGNRVKIRGEKGADGITNIGLGWKVNYSTLTTASNGKCVYYSYSDSGDPTLDLGYPAWVAWNGDKVTIPRGCNIQPSSTLSDHYGNVIYSVYSLSDNKFHDMTWDADTDAWEYNTYNTVNSAPTWGGYSWTWNEANDIILAMYVQPSASGQIKNAQLFTPPKKYSELVEVAQGLAYNAEKVAKHYLSVDNTGAMVANMTGGTQRTPSNIPTGERNILITNADVKIRNGQTQLASYGESIILGQIESDKQNILIDTNGVTIRDYQTALASYDASGITIGKTNGENINITNNEITIGKTDSTNKNVSITSSGVDIKSGNTTISHFGDTIRIGKESKENIAVGSNSVSLNATDGSNALKLKFESVTAYDTSDHLICTKYGSRVTDSNNMSFIKIIPAIGNNSFLNTLDYLSNMNNINLTADNDIQLNSGDNISIDGGDHVYIDANNGVSINGDVSINGSCLCQSILTFSTVNDFRNKIYGGTYAKLNTLVPYLFIGETEWSRSVLGKSTINGTSWGVVFCYSASNVHALFMYGGDLYKTVWNGSTFTTNKFVLDT